MIVKNEEHLIERALNSARPIVDCYAIQDNGSTDHSAGVITNWLMNNTRSGSSYSLYHEEWRDFSYNRNHCLDWARGYFNADYVLILDADDEIIYNDGFKPDEFRYALEDDAYWVQVFNKEHGFKRRQLFSLKRPFYYKGVVHEHLRCLRPYTLGECDGFYVKASCTGARSLNPNKYLDDANLIEEALRIETDPVMIARYREFLAKSRKWHKEAQHAS